jgi:endonuclease/exonuclease/phosphatase family metal-dependent hydrolase
MVELIAGTWNIENYFLPGGDFGPKTQEAFDDKTASLAATIAGSGVELLAVQEVGDPAALDALVARLGDPWTSSLSTHFEAEHPIRVGFLSRLPFASTSEWWEIPAQLSGVPTDDTGTPLTAMGRGVLVVELSVGGTSVRFASVHLKSKLISYPGGRFSPRDEEERARFTAYALLRRAAEATAVRYLANDVLDGHGQDRPFVVMGDVNDGPLAATTQLVQGPDGSQYGTGGYDAPDKGDAWRMWNIAPLLPPGSSSRTFEGQPELIDNVFVSHALRDLVRDPSIVAPEGGQPSIAANPTVRRDAPSSDHSMVRFTLDLA